MRISDWSSDVCSSDLRRGARPGSLRDRGVAADARGRPAEVGGGGRRLASARGGDGDAVPDVADTVVRRADRTAAAVQGGGRRIGPPRLAASPCLVALPPRGGLSYSGDRTPRAAAPEAAIGRAHV